MRHRFATISAVLVLLTVGGALSISPAVAAQDRSGPTRSNLDRTRIALLVYQNQSARDADARRGDAVTRDLRRRAETAEAGTARTRAELAGIRAQGARAAQRVASLERQLEQQESELSEAIEGYTGELARRDEDYARERSVLISTGERLLQTPEGRRVLDLYNAGGRENWQEARQVLETMRRVRRALDARDSAVLYSGARDRGLETTANVIRLYEEVVRDDPGNHWDWVELARLYRDANALDGALRAATAAYETSANDRDRSVAGNELGEVLIARNDLSGALARYEEGLDIARRLAAADPNSASHQHDIAVSLERIGGVLVARNDLSGALARYEETLGILRRLAAADPTSASLQRDMSVGLNKIGDVLVARNDLSGALVRYEEALEIRRRLGAGDPTSASLQRDISASVERIGDVLFDRNDLSGALVRYEDMLGIRRRLAAADPTSASHQLDLSISLGRIGDVLVARNELSGALIHYEGALDIARRLAAADPTSAGHQRHIAAWLWQLASITGRGFTWTMVAAQYDRMRENRMLAPRDEDLAAEARWRAQQETGQ